MNFLPKELENIINNYKHQMEHKEKIQSTLKEINKITYIESEGTSWRSYGITSVNYYGGLNEDIYENCYELWIHSYETTPPYTNGDLGEEIETITTIYEEIEGIFVDIETEQTDLIDIDDVSEGYQFQ
jgi:hypothetical protein